MLEKKQIYNDLSQIFQEKNILVDEPMSKHTSFRTGGNADFLVKIENEEELTKILEYANKKNIPITIIGNGTNLLVRDKGIRGIVIILKMKNIKVDEEENNVIITAEAGAALTKLSKIAKEYSAEGLEFAVGIPGTLGGAIKMNAGAYGSEIKNVIVSTKYIEPSGNIKIIDNNEHEFSYRNSVFSKINGIIIESIIKLKKGNIEQIEKKMKENRASRIEKQPIDKPNAGSTFKRGEGYITAKLIDECGLKGYKIGGAEVSTKHAGFVVNSDNAKTEDILKLVEHIKSEVYNKFGVSIEPEIQIIGEE